MKIYLNEKLLEVKEGTSVYKVKELYKKDADIIIYNAFPIKEDVVLQPMDKVVLIKRGEIPSKDELESLLLSRHTPFVHEKIKKAVIGIAGLGGLGSNAAVALARMGIGKLILADFDIVEPSNLNRQQYFVKHIGMKKTEALKEIIGQCNPFVEIETFDGFLDKNNVEEIFSKADIIIEAFDSAECKAMISEVVLTKMKSKKLVAASGVAGSNSSNTIRTKKINENFYIVGDMETEAKVGCGLMASRVAVAANHQANAVLRIILEQEV